MKIQLLPTTFDENGVATQHQHLCCLVINNQVTIDAGSLAMAASEEQKKNIRDVILTHAHLDHIAGLPLFIDDLFATLESPIRIHGLPEVIKALDQHIFNWVIYPKFSELKNRFGEILSYQEFSTNEPFEICGITFKAVDVNHKVPSAGFVVSDSSSKIAISSDTSEMETFWEIINAEKDLKALLIECAFPNELEEIADSSHHLTPSKLANELTKFKHQNCPVYVTNIKPRYREMVLAELASLKLKTFKFSRSVRFTNSNPSCQKTDALRSAA